MGGVPKHLSNRGHLQSPSPHLKPQMFQQPRWPHKGNSSLENKWIFAAVAGLFSPISTSRKHSHARRHTHIYTHACAHTPIFICVHITIDLILSSDSFSALTSMTGFISPLPHLHLMLQQTVMQYQLSDNLPSVPPFRLFPTIERDNGGRSDSNQPAQSTVPEPSRPQI